MKVQEIIGNMGLEEVEQNSPLFCLPKCYIGAEFEWENLHKLPLQEDYPSSNPHATLLDRFYSYYAPHQDGSLRGSSSEFVFRKPMSGTLISGALDCMDEVSRIYEFKGSYRTSLHIHLDMQNQEFPKDIVLLGALYCLVEPFFYKFVGQQRDVCNYCIPWYSHPQHFNVFFSGMERQLKQEGGYSTRTSTKLKELKSYKYAGLNLFSLGDFGTVEFRHAPVDMQKAKIIVWINAIMRLKKYINSNRGLTIDTLLLNVEKMGPTNFLMSLLDSEFREITKFSKNIAEDFQIGLKTCYYFISASK